jgi:hypothetical protein
MLKVLLHKIVASILIVILFTNNINTLAIIGDFIVNQELIAKTLCIQKEDQQGCNGKCHLKNQLAQNNSDSNNSSPLQKNERTTLDIYCVFYQYTFDLNLKEGVLSKVINQHTTSRIIKTPIQVETPPPIFS